MISVCIATYNGEIFIREQIDSILRQLSSDDEIIVSDDGSTDDTISIINSIDDKRIIIIEGPRKHSPTPNFECALKASKGDFIFMSDQDDVWKPNKVNICMEWLQRYDCVVSDAEVTDSSLNPLYPSLYAIMQVKQGRIYNTIWKNGYTGCCISGAMYLKHHCPFQKTYPCTIYGLGMLLHINTMLSSYQILLFISEDMRILHPAMAKEVNTLYGSR